MNEKHIIKKNITHNDFEKIFDNHYHTFIKNVSKENFNFHPLDVFLTLFYIYKNYKITDHILKKYDIKIKNKFQKINFTILFYIHKNIINIIKTDQIFNQYKIFDVYEISLAYFFNYFYRKNIIRLSPSYKRKSIKLLNKN